MSAHLRTRRGSGWPSASGQNSPREQEIHDVRHTRHNLAIPSAACLLGRLMISIRPCGGRLRVSIAKHDVSGRKHSVALWPGYERINAERLYSIEASGFATDSSGLHSAATAQRKATSAAASIRSEPSRYPANTLQRQPVSIRAPNNQGPPTPPAPGPIA